MDINGLIRSEEERQRDTLMLIPSENYTYPQVREAVGSVLMHKYSEGYPGKRYYQGNAIIDEIETIAIEEAKKTFNVPHANVQSYSGSPANSAVYMALLEPGDTIMGLNLASGGHLTHGHPNITFSGKYYKSVQYSVTHEGLIDFDQLEKLAEETRPRIIVAGLTAYSRKLDWKRFSVIAESTHSLLLADISHIAGLVAGGAHESPVEYAHVVTTTTHKTLRGPRGALIMVTEKGLKHDSEMGKRIDRAVFPGLQGGPHDNTTAGIAITLQKAQTPEFKKYAQQIVLNASALSQELTQLGYAVVSGGTDNHLFLIDLQNKAITGKEAAVALEKAGIVVNANAVPFDPAPPLSPSGIRIGTPALTARGMEEKEMNVVAHLIHDALSNSANEEKLHEISIEVKSLLADFPLDF